MKNANPRLDPVQMQIDAGSRIASIVINTENLSSEEMKELTAAWKSPGFIVPLSPDVHFKRDVTNAYKHNKYRDEVIEEIASKIELQLSINDSAIAKIIRRMKSK